METKKRRLSIKLTDTDFTKIHNKAVLAHKNITDYVTSTCLGKQIIRIDGLDEIIRQQKAIGRNLNQLTTLANMGRITAVDLSETEQQLAQISAELHELLERRRWSK